MKLNELILLLQKYQVNDEVDVELFVTGNGSSIYLQGLDIDGQRLVQIMDNEP